MVAQSAGRGSASAEVWLIPEVVEDAGAPEERVGAVWRRLSAGAAHLAFVRRVWGALGGWLRTVKNRGLGLE